MGAGRCQVAGFDTLIFEKDQGIAFITLNRPRHLNAFSVGMRDDLFEVLTAIKDDEEIKAVILMGAGDKAFCAGADLSEFLSAPPPVAARRVRWQRDIWGLFLQIPQPVIAAVHGFVLGSGIEMSLCCDIRLASADAQFGLPEVALGIIPAAGGTQTLPRLIGPGKAMELLLTNEWIPAQEALRIGLVNRVVPRETLYEQALSVARRIAGFSPSAVRMIKQAVVRGMDMTLAQGLDLEKQLALRLKEMKR
jgi:enoyl-CoA hydratase/carnithine racemase